MADIFYNDLPRRVEDFDHFVWRDHTKPDRNLKTAEWLLEDDLAQYHLDVSAAAKELLGEVGWNRAVQIVDRSLLSSVKVESYWHDGRPRTWTFSFSDYPKYIALLRSEIEQCKLQKVAA